jgi:hypothetical protein
MGKIKNQVNGEVMYLKDFGTQPILGSSTTLFKFSTHQSQVKQNSYMKHCYITFSFINFFLFSGSHDRVYKSASAAMKGSKTFEDLLKSDNDVTSEGEIE